MSPSRPVVDDHGEKRTATFPAANVDIDASFREALAQTRSYSRMSEPAEIEKAACDYMAECMKTAIVDLAFLAHDKGHLASSSGWEMRISSSSYKEMVFVLTHQEKPGAWGGVIDLAPVMTEDAKSRLRTLSDSLEEQLLSQGLDRHAIMMRSILGRSKDPLPVEIEISALKKDGMSYEPVAADHVFREMRAYSVRLPAGGWNGRGCPGIPPGTEDSSDLTLLDPATPEKRAGWAFGYMAKLSPVRRYNDTIDALTPSSGRDGVVPGAFTEIVSDLIRSNGLEAQVLARNPEIGNLPWITYSHSPLLEELGYALAHRAGGLFDASVTATIRDYSASIAAMDMRNHLEEFVALVPRLIEKGHVSPDTTFDANDMRDQGHAEIDGNTLMLFTRTQNGSYRVDIRMEEDRVAGVTCHRMAGSEPVRQVARFVMADAGLVHDYDGAFGGEPPIDYSIRNIRDVNNIILSLSSIACVFEEEHGPAEPEDVDAGMEP